MEHSARLEESIKSYLSGLTTFTDGLTFRVGESDEDKTADTVTCYVDGDMGDEMPEFSNNRYCEFVVELKTPVIQDDPDTNWLSRHQTNTAAIENAILDDGFEAAISNSTIYVYRCMNRRPIDEQTPDYWMSGYRFRIYSCRVN